MSHGDPVTNTDYRSLFNFSLGQFRRFISIWHSHWPIITKIGEITDADKSLNFLHFGSDLADTWTRSNSDSNPESRWSR